jgi:hypothetical protein
MPYRDELGNLVRFETWQDAANFEVELWQREMWDTPTKIQYARAPSRRSGRRG